KVTRLSENPMCGPLKQRCTPWLIAFGVLTSSPAAGAEQIDAAAIDALVNEAIRSWEVPGVALAIVRDGRVAYLKGFGLRDADRKERMTADTTFPLASCTKAFTTTAMAMLVDEGKMDWDDPVRKHVSFFRLA